MGPQEISHASIITPGADLWIVPERNNSFLAQKIDWYLNFQIAKSAQHQARQLSAQVVDILKKCALPSHDWVEDPKNCLMVLSHHVFPNRWVLVVRGSDDFSDWMAHIYERWEKMQFPTLRIFLPKGVSTADFERVAKKWDYGERVTFVIEGSNDE